MPPLALAICRILDSFRIWPECSICERNQSFEEHAPAKRHLTQLGDLDFKGNAPLTQVRIQLWQQWLLPGGAVRINHADGAIEMCRDAPPGEASASSYTMPFAQPRVGTKSP